MTGILLHGFYHYTVYSLCPHKNVLGTFVPLEIQMYKDLIIYEDKFKQLKSWGQNDHFYVL